MSAYEISLDSLPFVCLATFDFNRELLKRCCGLSETARSSTAGNPLRALRGLLLKDAAELYLIDATGLLQLSNTRASEAVNKEEKKK